MNAIARMRIAIFTFGLPVPGQKRGGIERVAHELADGLARRGHRVVVWTHDPKPAGAAYEIRVLPLRRFVSSWLGRRLTMGYLGNVLAILPDYGRPDAIIAHGDSLLLPLVARNVVRVMHGSALAEARSATSPWRAVLQTGIYLQELLTALLQRNCIGVSENTRRWNPFVRHVIPNGVDRTAFWPAPNDKTKHPSILFVGAMTGRKRGATLLQWFVERVRLAIPNARLDIVGTVGPTENGVTYHTGIDNAELAAMYRRVWVYATPSTYEGFGLPYLEAMASGTPVIATPNPGSREVLENGRFGVLADDTAFPDELIRMLTDEARRAEWTARGLEQAERFSLTHTLDRYETFLQNLCRPRRNRETTSA